MSLLAAFIDWATPWPSPGEQARKLADAKRRTRQADVMAARTEALVTGIEHTVYADNHLAEIVMRQLRPRP